MRPKHFLGMTLAFVTLLLPTLTVSAKAQLPLIQKIETSVGELPVSLARMARGNLLANVENRAPELADIAAGEVLKQGHVGPAVRQIKHLMRKLGYNVKSGDVFDLNLAAQIGSFQTKHHLSEPYGPHWCEVGPATLQALFKAARSKPYDPNMGHKLVEYARAHISGGSYQCYFYVARTIHSFFHPFLEGMHAYMAADYLAGNPDFKELKVPASKLGSLPAGAIVVWDKGHSVSGHISIADGKGNEISDHISPQMLSHYGGAGARVFLPVIHSF